MFEKQQQPFLAHSMHMNALRDFLKAINLWKIISRWNRAF